MVEILTKPKNALVKQYQHLLSLDGVELDFDKEALGAIAQEALKRKTGARGLRSIIEKIMKNVITFLTYGKKHQILITTQVMIKKNGNIC